MQTSSCVLPADAGDAVDVSLDGPRTLVLAFGDPGFSELHNQTMTLELVSEV